METSALGLRLREYGGKTPARIKFLVAFGLLFMLPLGVVLVAFMIEEPPTETADVAGGVALIALCFVVGVGPVIVWLIRRSMRVALHEHGIAVMRGESLRSIVWDEIETVRLEIVNVRVNGIPAGTHCTCKLQTTTGAPLVLDLWLDGVMELAQRIEDEACRRRLPRAASVVASGGTVEFGRALAVSAQGISKRGGEPLPWSEIESIVLADGFITVRKRGKRLPWARRSYGALPNAPVFLALVRAHVPVAG